MDELAVHLRAVTRIALYFLSGMLLIWALLPNYRPLAAGFILGTAVSLFNAHYTAWKIRQMTRMILEQGRKRFNLGTITRASTSLLAVLISVRWEQVAFSTTLAGLFVAQLVTVVVGIIFNLQEVNKTRKG